MPLMKCTSGGKSGWKYGESGKCYTGPGAKAKAEKQAAAIGASKARKSGSSVKKGIAKEMKKAHYK